MLVAELKKCQERKLPLVTSTTYARKCKGHDAVFLVTGEKLPHCAPEIKLGGIFTVFVNW